MNNRLGDLINTSSVGQRLRIQGDGALIGEKRRLDQGKAGRKICARV